MLHSTINSIFMAGAKPVPSIEMSRVERCISDLAISRDVAMQVRSLLSHGVKTLTLRGGHACPLVRPCICCIRHLGMPQCICKKMFERTRPSWPDHVVLSIT